MDDGHGAGDVGQVERLLDRGVAAADDDDVARPGRRTRRGSAPPARTPLPMNFSSDGNPE